jgi:4-carboxymuconolactone decarboxylase
MAGGFVFFVQALRLRWRPQLNRRARMTQQLPSTKDFEKGLATRKQVMGEDFVANAFGNATAFTQPIQEFITRNAWGDVWQRPGLDMKTRSLITVAFLTALGKQHELKGHVRGALNNGATAAEIQEVLLHASIYCGLPTAVEAFRTAADVIDGPK